MGKVKFKKGTLTDFNAIDKDPDTLYAVNENGDFSEENMEDSAELFIGDKRITPEVVDSTGQSTTSVMSQKAVTDAISSLQTEVESKSADFYGECNISPSTVAKTVTTTNGNFVLKKGAKVSVKFLQGHTASTMTLNVDGTGAKNVYRDGNSPKTTMVKAYNVYDFVFDGTYWRIIGVDTDTTYSNATTTASGLMSSDDKKKTNAIAVDETKKSVTIGYNNTNTGNSSFIMGRYCTTNGQYSVALGYSNINGVLTGDNTYKYGKLTTVKTIAFTYNSTSVYGVSIPKGTTPITFVYNEIEYTLENTNTSYVSSLCLVQDSNNTLFKADLSPKHVSICHDGGNISNAKILSSTHLQDNIYALLINQQTDNIYNYSNTAFLTLWEKTSSTLYDSTSSMNFGYSSYCAGDYSSCFGEQSVSSGRGSVSFGRFGMVEGNYCFSSGIYNSVAGEASMVVGFGNKCNGNYAFTAGVNNKALHDYSTLIGNGLSSNRMNQVILGSYNAIDNTNIFIIGQGTSNDKRKNILTVSTTGVVTANTFKGALQGNADTATKVKNVLTIKNGDTTETYDGSAAKTIDITDLQNIGDLSNLQTSDTSNLVAAINEVNTKANNNTGGGVVNDSTISPFAGFLPTGATVIEQSTLSTDGEVLYDSDNNRFVWKDRSGTFVQYYANWITSYLYNVISDSATTTPKSDKLFSYNDAHYMVINGVLQDISNIESVLKNYAVSIALSIKNDAVSEANTYTDDAITAKIQLVSALPSAPVDGVLYLIPDE